MRRNQRNCFIYGVLLSSAVWIVIVWFYTNLQSNSLSSRSTLYYPRDTHDDGHLALREHSLLEEAKSQQSELDLRQLGLIHSDEDQMIRDQGYKLYAFNNLINQRLSLNRTLPDTRYHLCKNKHYNIEELPSASIVICLYNEAWHALLRTLHTVLLRSPKKLIHEIIIIDDFSDLKHLQSQLELYLKENTFLDKVKLFRTKRREGLIRARMFGAEQATGDVLIFLDSHCEVNIGWIEPLLTHIHLNPQSAAIPIIDIVNHDTFAYEASPLVRGGFNWGLHFRWDQIPSHLLSTKEAYAEPIKTPTMAGGLFAINRHYFNTMGKYDSGMDVWGGENLEISFRIWQCGGSLAIIPCSRVGHIFRQRRPYGSGPEDSMLKNSLRLAHVWMDDYIEYYFKLQPGAKDKPYGVVEDRIALRQALQCKSFKWYLENVYPEQTLPDEQGKGGFPKGEFRPQSLSKSNVVREGLIVHSKTGMCVVSDGKPYDKKSLLKLSECKMKNNEDQTWVETDLHEMKLAGILCMEAEPPYHGHSVPRLAKCRMDGGRQEWVWHGKKGSMLLNTGLGKCASVTGLEYGAVLSTDICDEGNLHQRFIMKLI